MYSLEGEHIGLQYRGYHAVEFIEDPFISERESHAMDMAFDLAEEALKNGNPPVGAVLLVGNEAAFGARTVDKTTGKLNGHAEVIAYEAAHQAGAVGDDLSECTLISTAALCSSCTPLYAEGKIGKIITAAPRDLIYPLTGIMRPRQFNMHELLYDGDTETLWVPYVEARRSLGLFALYGVMKQHTYPANIDPILQPLIEEALAA